MLNELRYGLAILLAALGVLASAFAGGAWFTRQTIYDTDAFVEATQPVFSSPAVQTAIAENVTEAVFAATGFARPEIDPDADNAEADDAADAEATIQIDQPPASEDGDEAAIDPAFGEAIAFALEDQTADIAVQVLQRPAVQSALVVALRESHAELISVIHRSDNPEIEIDLEPVLTATVNELSEDSQLGFLAAVQIEPGTATFVVARDAQGGTIWWRFLRTFDDWNTSLMVFTFVAIALAVAISPERDRLLLGAGTGLTTIALVIIGFVFASRKLAGSVFIRDEVTRGAFDEVFAALAAPLIRLEVIIAIIGGVMIVAGAALGFYLSRFRGEKVWAGQEQPSTLDFTPGGSSGGY